MRKRLPSYRLHKPTGQGVVTLGGRDHYLGKFGTAESHQRYNQLIADWISAGRKRIENGPSPGIVGTISDVCLKWYRDFAVPRYQKSGKPTKQLDRARRAVRALREMHGSLRVERFGAAELQQLRDSMVHADLGRSYVNHLIGVVKQLICWGATHGMIPVEAAHASRLIKGLARADIAAGVRVREVPPVTSAVRAHVDITLSWLPPVVADLFRVQLLTGMRPCEVCGMRPADISQGGQLRNGLRFSGVWIYEVPDESNKNAHRGHSRVVMLGPRAQNVIAPYLADRGQLTPIFSPRETVLCRVGHIGSWKRGPGHTYSAAPLAHVIARVHKRQVEMGPCPPRWAPNQLRHLRASEIRAKYGSEAARVVLGHRLAGVTGRYADPDLELQARVMREIG